jgi:hypothetical protein
MTPLETALAYFEAWSGKDLDRALTYVDEGIVCDAPPGRLEGAAAYRAFLTPFIDGLLSARILGAFGDERTALVMYDSATVLVPSAPGAELVTVRGGRIVASRFLFDRLPFYLARQAP